MHRPMNHNRFIRLKNFPDQISHVEAENNWVIGYSLVPLPRLSIWPVSDNVSANNAGSRHRGFFGRRNDGKRHGAELHNRQ